MAKGKFAAGAIFGALVGAVAALLTAPKSGKETRDDLKKKADEMKATAQKKAKEVKATADQKTAELKQKADEVSKNVKAQADDWRARAEGAVQGAKEGFNGTKPADKSGK